MGVCLAKIGGGFSQSASKSLGGDPNCGFFRKRKKLKFVVLFASGAELVEQHDPGDKIVASGRR